MNRQDAGKWAEAMKLASNPGADASFIAQRLMIEFPEPAPLCHVCESPLNGDTCPKCQPGAPPDVSALRFEGKEVEIAEPQKRKAEDGEMWTHHGQAVVIGKSMRAAWILRIKEQPPPPRRMHNPYAGAEEFHHENASCALWGCKPVVPAEPQQTTVYGVTDPREVDLSQLRGPNGRPVEWVDFREPNVLFDELVVWFDAMDNSLRICWAKSWKYSGPDKRRIIVREVEERKPRRFICEEPENDKGEQIVKTIAGNYKWVNSIRPLADLDDPKVVNSVLLQSNWNLAGSIHDQAKSLIQAYLEYPCKS